MKDNLKSVFSAEIDRLIRKLIILDRNEKVCHGVTMSQCCLIEALYINKILTMNVLGNKLGLAISTLTRITDILVRDSIVKRDRSSKDRRKVCISLTDKGKNLAKKLIKCSEKYKQDILETIPLKKRQQIIDSLKQLNRAVEITNQICCV
ncbi:MAG: MarR family transcriptional regulator [bacterium]